MHREMSCLRLIRIWLATLAITLGCFTVFSLPTNNPPNDLIWRRNKSVDAGLDQWPLKKLLGRLAAVTGWKVYVDPSLDQSVSVKFANVPQSEALKLLLGGLNYALVPQGRIGSKLYIYKNSLHDATALVAPERTNKAANWIANELILTLSPDSKENVEKLAAELGGKIVGKSEGLNSY